MRPPRPPEPLPSEDETLAQLKRPELTAAEVETLARHPMVQKYRKMRIAIVAHPHTPRHIALPIIRQLYTFELMDFALLTTVAADLRRAAEDVLVSRLESVTTGERISLARRASGRIAAALLLDADERVVAAALNNSRLVEAGVVQAVMNPAAPSSLAPAVFRHEKWPLRAEVRIALLRSEHTTLAEAITLADKMPDPDLRQVLTDTRLDAKVRTYLDQRIARRAARTKRRAT